MLEPVHYYPFHTDEHKLHFLTGLDCCISKSFSTLVILPKGSFSLEVRSSTFLTHDEFGTPNPYHFCSLYSSFHLELGGRFHPPPSPSTITISYLIDFIEPCLDLRLKVSHGDLIYFQENDARILGEEIRRSFYIEISVEKIIGKFLEHLNVEKNQSRMVPPTLVENL